MNTMRVAAVMAAVSALGLAGMAQAVPVDATGGVVINTVGNTTTIDFDLPSNNGDIAGNADGLFFDLGSGLNLTVTSTPSGTSALVDDPANGGLGVDPGTQGDNLGPGESLIFSFNSVIDLDDILFNGIFARNGHQDESDGSVTVTSSAGSSVLQTTQHDGVGGNDVPFSISAISGFTVAAGNDFGGYVETITVSRRQVVPEPSSLLLMGLGLLGLGAGARARRRSS